MEFPENIAMYADDVFLNPETQKLFKKIKDKIKKKSNEDKKEMANIEESYLKILSEKKAENDKWIAGAVKKKGSLHKALGVPKDEKIPMKKLEVKAGDSPKMKNRKQLAKTLKKLHEVLVLEKAKKEKWIQKAIERPGALHKALEVPEDKKIPMKKLEVKPGDSIKMKKRKILAQTLKKISNKKKLGESLTENEQRLVAAVKSILTK